MHVNPCLASALVLALFSTAVPAAAQQVRSAYGPAPAAPSHGYHQHRSIPRVDLQCEPYRTLPHVYVYCVTLERDLAQGQAKRQGAPIPSARIYAIPAQGSERARVLGLACIAGTAMRRLDNGWEQLRESNGNWVRCKDA